MVLGHGRTQIQYVTMGGTRGKITHIASTPFRTVEVVEIGTILALFGSADVVGRLRLQHRVLYHKRRDQHDTDLRTARGST